MSAPAWSALAGLLLLTALCALGQLLTAFWRPRKLHFDIDASHVVMALAMAGMFKVSLDIVPHYEAPGLSSSPSWPVGSRGGRHGS